MGSKLRFIFRLSLNIQVQTIFPLSQMPKSVVVAVMRSAFLHIINQ